MSILESARGPSENHSMQLTVRTGLGSLLRSGGGQVAAVERFLKDLGIPFTTQSNRSVLPSIEIVGNPDGKTGTPFLIEVIKR